MEYFKAHPKRDLPRGPVVDWVEEKYLEISGKKSRDTWRAIRKLHQEGQLIKVKKGIYGYDPDRVRTIELADFPQDIRKDVFKRDGYQCVICGQGRVQQKK